MKKFLAIAMLGMSVSGAALAAGAPDSKTMSEYFVSPDNIWISDYSEVRADHSRYLDRADYFVSAESHWVTDLSEVDVESSLENRQPIAHDASPSPVPTYDDEVYAIDEAYSLEGVSS